MKLLPLLFSLIFFVSNSIGQEPTIQFLVLKQVNHLRDSLNLPQLSEDHILKLAAEDHAYYMNQKRKLSHFQNTFTKETPAARVEYYKGNRTYIGENIALTSAKYVNDKQLNRSTIAKDLYNAWLNSPPHYQNLITPQFTKMGLGFYVGSNNELYAAQVFSSNEIVLPKEFISVERAWGVRPTEFTCKDEPETYETMFFANSIQVEGNNIYFYFHDLDFFKKVIANDNDGLAIDIILREQLPCGKENQFHISPIYDGEMQKPIYKNDIFRTDVSNNPKKIKVKVGEVPAHLKDKQWEANIIIINNNKLCDYSYPVEVPSAIYPLLKIKPKYDFNDNPTVAKAGTKLHIKDSIHIELMYERSKNNYHALNTFEYYKMAIYYPFIKKVYVNIYASVEGANWYNSRLLKERELRAKELLQSIGFKEERIQIDTAENWAKMYTQIDNYSINSLKNLSKSQIKQYLKKNPSPFFDSLLFDQRINHIYAIIDTNIQINNYSQYTFASNYYPSINLSSLSINKILREDYILLENIIEIPFVDSIQNNLKVKTNLLGAVSIEDVNINIDSTVVSNLISNIDNSNPKQVFNYGIFLTKYWYSRFSRSYETKKVVKTITPNELMNLVSNIDSLEVENNDLNRLKLNIILSGVHYYVAYNDWSEVENYFNAISDLVKQGDFNAQEALELALFCNHFHKFKIAIDILHPFYLKDLLTENGIFVLAQTATLIRDIIPPSDYYKYMKKAKMTNHQRYCNWLNNAFQIQRDEIIKADYCKSCN